MRELSRLQKRSIVVATDIVFCLIAVWTAFALRVGALNYPIQPILIFAAATLVLFLSSFTFFGVYKAVIRFIGLRTIRDIAVASFAYSIPLIAIFGSYTVADVPRTVAILHPILFFGAAASWRMIARYLLTEVGHELALEGKVQKVVIYGADTIGQQLALQLRHEPSYRLIAFFDSNTRLKGQKLDGVPVRPFDDLRSFVAAEKIDIVLLAVADLSRSQQREIVDDLAELHAQVKTLPRLREMVDGNVSINDLREVDVEDLLGRDPVAPDELLLNKTIAGKVVLVTGAGGSIGSELCRQIVKLRPKRLILLEMSEPALYHIDRELKQMREELGLHDVDVVPELLTMTDADGTRRVFASFRPETVFHAAAYKHVPLVEANVISGLRNNILGTVNAVRAAEAVGTEYFILVSTDKAVRPTNVMGASKRICELVLQAMAMDGGVTRFAMVRFGNVLGSSGSVVPLFKQQILAGGPVTLTHRDVTRYFMTIPEAAQLVIQAGAMAHGGEVYLLDMGPSVKIYDLARTIIHVMGLAIKDENNPNGDIEIVEVGLRPGEKLYEELLIDAASETTSHPRISRAHEDAIPRAVLRPQIDALTEALSQGNRTVALRIMAQLVPEYQGNKLDVPSNTTETVFFGRTEPSRPSVTVLGRPDLLTS